MPSSLTHHWFAKQQLEHTPLAYRPSSQAELEAYFVGAQGPDPLFFYGFIPWRKRNNKAEVNAFGSYLHQQEMAEKFERMIAFLRTREHPTELGILRSFLLGTMTHYVLDRNVHPYVFYRSGFSQTNAKRYEALHAQYETMIDVTLLHHFHLSPRTHPAKNVIRSSPHAMWWVSQMYAAEEQVAQSDWYYESWRDMLTVEKALYDPWGLKRALLRLVGLKESQMYAMIHPCGALREEAHDYLNNQHKPWRHPGSGKHHQESVWDLFDQAAHELQQGFHVLEAAFTGTEEEAAFATFCANRDYSGLLPEETLQYHESIYDIQSASK